jgi:peroxin-1
MKEVMLQVWKNNANVLTIATSTNSITELPSLFHCLDEHGILTTFLQIKSAKSTEVIEIVKNLLSKRNTIFDQELLTVISEQMEGFVFKDIERFIEKIIFNQWSKLNHKCVDKRRSINIVNFNDVKDIIYDYTSITMLETNLLKNKNTLNWNLIGGLEDTKKSLYESIIWPVKYEKLYRELGMKQTAGVLLYGPSGCE